MPRGLFRSAALLAALVMPALFAAPAAAQSFGQNKVQYYTFDWSYYQTEHFDIYFSQGGEPIARFAAEHIEEMYAKVEKIVGHKLTERVPVIVHNTHAEFEQTNVIPMNLHEGIGGFTERFKNRVVLPFEGSYKQFYHVLQHELVHATVFNMLLTSARDGNVRSYAGFPLWVNEGLAEYVSMGWDLGSEFFMIDATTFGYVAPPASDFGGFLAYKGGQLFFHFLETVYGEGTSTRFIQNLAKSGDMGEAFRKTTKTSLEEAGEIWLRELRHLYWPELGRRQYGKSVARRLTFHGRDRSFYNLQPSLSPNGEEIAFFSDRESWEAVYILNVKTEKVTRAVIEGGTQGEHESFHSFKSGISWSPDGKQLAVVSKQGGKDVIHLLDAKSGKVKRVLKPRVLGILSPSWSPDGRRIAFSGQQDGFSDLYVYELEADSARRLTFDMATDDKPSFSPSGNWIAFESDRPGPGAGPMPYDSLRDFMDIYRIPVGGGRPELVAGGRWDEKMPSYGPSDSTLMFVSNRSGLDNIYLWKDGAAKPVTNLLTGTFTPSWSRDGKLLAFSLFEAGGWDIYLMKDPLDKVMAEPLPETRFIRAQGDSVQAFFRAPAWENLNSWNADSVRKARAREEKARKKRKGGKAAAGDTLIPAASYLAARSDSSRLDSLRADSLKTARADSLKTVRADSARAADSARSAAQDSSKASRRKKRRTPFLADSAAYKSDTGFVRREYRPKWSFDGASAGVAADNQYGYGGLAYMTLSDLMGDQQLSFALSINGSLENTSVYLEYAYLPHRIDYTLTGFREAQEIQHTLGLIDYHAVGAGAGLRYPFSPFTRVQADVFALSARREEYFVAGFDTAGYVDSIAYFESEVTSFLPSVAWVHDNAQWGLVGPVAGRRLLAVAQYLPPLFQDEYSYVKGEIDLRFYKEFFKRYTLAARVSAGASEAVSGHENPHAFRVGGEAYTFNSHFNFDRGPSNLAEFYLSDLDFPLRGYDIYDFEGTRKFLSNVEFRFPFVREFSLDWPIPLSVTNVMGNLFVDWGGAWTRGNPFSQMGVGYGYGLRLNLGIFILKYTRAESVDDLGGYRHGTRQYWSLGSEF
jgi:Tol biopolymer transport system component